MSLNIRPVFSALLRNRAAALLVAMQIAIALAVLVNAVFIVHQRIEKMRRPTGIDDANQFMVWGRGFTPRYHYAAAFKEDLAYLRSLPGVVDAAPTNTAPMCPVNQSTQLQPHPQRHGPSTLVTELFMDEHGLRTLGARLIAGRNFRPDEILPALEASNASEFVPELIVTQSLARRFFPPDGNALGKVLYDEEGHAATIIGIATDMIGTQWGDSHGYASFALMPRLSNTFGSAYLVRTEPGRRDAIVREVEEHLAGSNPDRVIETVRSLEFYRHALYLQDRSTAIFLASVTVLITLITCIGIFGLATFNVSTRTKQIGTRRALGARRRDVISYFMVENGLVSTAGTLAGCLLALGAGYWLSLRYELPRLDLYYLVGGVLVLWAVGQLAAWQPARRAAAVPPSVATRTV